MKILEIDGVPVAEEQSMSTSKKVKVLQEAQEDFEWYPTTDEILAAFAKDLYKQAKRFSPGRYSPKKNTLFSHNESSYNSDTGKDEDYISIGSMLDVGAGDGRVFNAIKDPRPGYRFSIDEKYGIEKARAQSDDLIRKGVFIIGRDFFQTTLIDKEFSVIFSNPPYSIYEPWTLRLLHESSFGVMYLVLPVRWESNKEIIQYLKDYEYENIGEYDFLHGDRTARARVNLIRITHKIEKIDGCEYMREAPDPFVRWVEETIGKFESESESENLEPEEENWIMSKRGDKIDELVDQYNYEMQSLISGFKAIGKLPTRVIHSLGMDKESMLKIIRQNIETLKDRFWRLAFDRIDPITERLTKDTRKGLLGKMHQFKSLDFNLDNIYSIIIWVIENFNLYTNEQIVKMFKELTEPDYIKAYKSNNHWDKETWRYGSHRKDYKDNPFSGEKGKGKPEKYILDYRFVTRSHYQKYYNEYTIINDFIVVLRSLGASIHKKWFVNPTDYGNLQRVMMDNGGPTWKEDIAFECRFYQNGNVHLKVNQDLMMRFNIEVARILGWVHGPEDIQEEFEISEDEAVKYWTKPSLQMIGRSDLKMLEFKEVI